MPQRDSTARPGRAPGSRPTTGTLFAALYGELAPHPWRGHDSEHDAYQLFHQYALAMGWLDDGDGGGGAPSAPGLWGMNDAGWDHPLGLHDSGLVSWFQVEAGAVAPDRPLPVRPFLRCSEVATERAGELGLSAVQLLLPVQGLDASVRPAYARVPSMRTVHWFAEPDPRARTAVRVGVDSGQDPSVPAVGQQLADELGRLEQAVFTCTGHHLAEGDHVGSIPPPFGDALWNGPSGRALVLEGELCEWSTDAIGWLAEAIADCTAHLGARTPLLLTITRSDADA
ncbi:hypothetical protein [Streptomyces sp. ODS28]|uniref:hypothetical protein n=1 Tax=Streptomyces sp. ODS28 TaxID=3136688 RepID=UPI0031EDE562